MTGRPRLGFAAAALLLLTACGASSEGDRGSASSATTAGSSATTSVSSPAPSASAGDTDTADTADTVAAASAPASVPDILQFQAPLLGGGTYDGATAAGKVTAYWFWAPT